MVYHIVYQGASPYDSLYVVPLLKRTSRWQMPRKGGDQGGHVFPGRDVVWFIGRLNFDYKYFRKPQHSYDVRQPTILLDFFYEQS